MIVTQFLHYLARAEIGTESFGIVMCRFVGFEPGVFGLALLHFKPESGSKSKIPGRIRKSVGGPCSGPFELSRGIPSGFLGSSSARAAGLGNTPRGWGGLLVRPVLAPLLFRKGGARSTERLLSAEPPKFGRKAVGHRILALNLSIPRYSANNKRY